MPDTKEPWLGKDSDKAKAAGSDKDKAKDTSDDVLRAKKDDDLDLDILIPDKPEADASDDGAGRVRPRLLPMWLLIAATAVAALAWAISDRMTGTEEAMDADAPVPFITAEDEPIKVRPDDPGGLDVPNRDKYVYKSLGEDEPEVGAEQLLPPPEEPLERPTPPVEVETVEAETPSPADLGLVSVEPASGVPGDDAAESTVAAIEPLGADEGLADQPSSQVASVVAPAPPKPTGAATGGDARQASVETGAASQTQTTASATTSTTAPPSGRYLIQIASTQEETAIEREWRRLLVRHSEVLGEKQKYVKRADLGDKGIWYRLQVGPFAQRDDASAACESLKAKRVGCFVVRN